MIDNALLFILSYLGLIAMGTLAVGGWFFVTRGWTTTLPNGSVKKQGKIFKGVYFYFMQERGTERIYYSGEELQKIADIIKAHLPEAIIKVFPSTVIIQQQSIAEAVQSLCKQLGYEVLPKGDGYFAFYKEYPVYRFPEYIRDPLAKCATCFSSLYGSIFYWTAYLLIGDYMFSWMRSGLAPLIFWIIFCFSLAIPLTALAKKYN